MRIFSLIVIFIFTLQIKAQTDKSEGLLSQVQEKYGSIIDLQADISELRTSSADKEIKGRLFYKKPDKLRIEFNNQEIVSDGRTVWNYNKKLGRAVINYTDSGRLNYSFNDLIFRIPPLCDVTGFEQNGQRGLILIPKSGDLDFSRLKLIINEDRMVTHAEITDHGDNVFKIRLSNIRTNQNISELKFKFSPPEGIEIIDLR